MSLEDLMMDLKKGLGMARVNAAVGLGKLKDKRAEKALIEAREAIDPLIRLLDSDASRVVKKSAIRSLGQIGGPKALRAVEPFKASTDAVLADMAKKAVEMTTKK
jgi:HEAT repeat protein